MTSIDPMILLVPLPAVGGTAFVRIPSGSLGGGHTVGSVILTNGATTSGGNGVTVDVLKATGGTPAISGTIAAGLAGTADHFTAGVAKITTPSAANAKVSANEWIAVKTTQVGTGVITAPAYAQITLVRGVTGA